MGEGFTEKKCIELLTETGNEGMTECFKQFQRTDAATGNERRPTVDRRNGGTCSSCDDDERSRRRPGRSATRVS